MFVIGCSGNENKRLLLNTKVYFTSFSFRARSESRGWTGVRARIAVFFFSYNVFLLYRYIMYGVLHKAALGNVGKSLFLFLSFSLIAYRILRSPCPSVILSHFITACVPPYLSLDLFPPSNRLLFRLLFPSISHCPTNMTFYALYTKIKR